MRIRSGIAEDGLFIREVALAVFSQFGPYGRLLPGWLLHPEVLTFVAEDETAAPLGYAMLALRPFDDEEIARERSGLLDLVAIAVAPSVQRRGVGRALLRHVLTVAHDLARTLAAREVRLSVAEPNLPARLLFEREGFRVVDATHGYYAGGQRSIRMGCRLAKPGDPFPGPGSDEEAPDQRSS